MITKILSLLAKILWIKQLGMLNGIALIISIYVHEYGHYFIADELKLKPKHPRFIPFLGAYVQHNITFDNKQQFKIAIAGPLLGGVFGIICFYISLLFNSNFFQQLAVFSVFLNLLNLIPFSILDGGQIASSLEFHKLRTSITLLLLVLGIYYKRYFLIFLGAIGLLSYFVSDNDKLKPMNKEDRDFGIFIYISLIIILVIHTYFILKNK